MNLKCVIIFIGQVRHAYQDFNQIMLRTDLITYTLNLFLFDYSSNGERKNFIRTSARKTTGSKAHIKAKGGALKEQLFHTHSF